MASLAGTWRLAEWAGESDGVHGLLILTDDGWFSINVANADGPVAVEAGSYDVEGDAAVMTSEVALNVNTVGMRRPRHWRVQGDILELQWDDAATRWHRARDEVVDSMGG
jgi:hypothetical protein